MTRLLIVDDHTLVRNALRRALEDVEYDVVGEAADGLEAVELASRLRPDVILMDVSMPVLDGIEATRRILRHRPDTRVLMLTMHADPDLVSRARSAGARGYLLKDASVEEVIAGVAQVASGRNVLSRDLAMPAAVTAVAPPTDQCRALSEREEEVLQLLADGCTPAEVAKALFISTNTVRNHLAKIYTKLDAHDRTQAVVEGLRRGYIRLREAV